MEMIFYGILIGINIGFLLGWIFSNKFNGDIEKFINWLEGPD